MKQSFKYRIIGGDYYYVYTASLYEDGLLIINKLDKFDILKQRYRFFKDPNNLKESKDFCLEIINKEKEDYIKVFSTFSPAFLKSEDFIIEELF